METGSLFLSFFALCGLGVLLGAVLTDRKIPSVLAFVSSLAALMLLWASGRMFFSGQHFTKSLWEATPFIRLSIDVDRLSSLFLFVSGLVLFPVSIFSAGYLKRYLGKYSLKSFAIFYHLLFASVAMILIAGDVFSFLIAWESMSILCYLLVNYEHKHPENIRSGFLMLSMSEAGTLAALLAFLIMAKASGNLSFVSLRSVNLGQEARWAVFLLSFFGFGVKAGLVPVNSWLPRAHTAAPGNFSSLLSTVLVNLGLYGILRINADLFPIRDVGQGIIVLGIGTLSAFIGILYATTENDMKRMLAHSSIENMGIVTAGLGAGFIFISSGYPVLGGIAFIAALYHMTNHSLYKSLLFLGAAAVDSRTGRRDMDRMGGLIRKMPWTSLFFLIGALSIASLPPFNGFISEWLTLQSLLQSSALASKGVKIAFAICGAGLALTAALAVTCFVKAFAMGFLGKARSEGAENASDAPRSMTIPMGILAVSCFLMGILPTYVIPQIDRVVTPYVQASAVDALVPPFFTAGAGKDQLPKAFVSEFHSLGAQAGGSFLPGRGLVIMHRGAERNPVVFAVSPSYTVIVLFLLLGASIIVVKWLTRKRSSTRSFAWNGGVRELLPAMTYTATGFSNPVRVVFNAVLRPITIQDSKETIAQHFRNGIRKDRKDIHLVDRLLVGPIMRLGRGLSVRLARMHSGHVNAYAAYILITLLLVLLVMRVT